MHLSSAPAVIAGTDVLARELSRATRRPTDGNRAVVRDGVIAVERGHDRRSSRVEVAVRDLPGRDYTVYARDLARARAVVAAARQKKGRNRKTRRGRRGGRRANG